MDNKVYSKRFKDGTTTYPTKAFIENGWVIIHQSEVTHFPFVSSYPSSINIPVSEFRKMIKQIGAE